MHRLSKPRLALILTGLGLVGLLAARQTGRANPIPPSSVVVPSVGFGGFGAGAAVNEELPTTPIYIQSPPSEKAARIWLRLQQPISMPFANETALEEALKYVRSSTVSDDFPNGIPIYVDPAGLQEADKTTQSPIVIQLEGLPLSLTLRLALKQLDLDYYVEPEGLLVVTYIGGADHPSDPISSLANEVLAARREIRQLRQDVADLKALNLARPSQTTNQSETRPSQLKGGSNSVK